MVFQAAHSRAITMDILRLFKIPFISLGCLLLSSCAMAEECANLVNSFTISNWKGKPPRSAILYRYQANGEFSNPIQVSRDGYQANIWWPKENKTPTLIMKFSDYGTKSLPVGADYTLILDDMYQFKIHSLERTRVSLGCQLGGGKVNSCSTIFGGAGIAFERECAEIIK